MQWLTSREPIRVRRGGTKDATTGIRSDKDGALSGGWGGGHIKAEIILL